VCSHQDFYRLESRQIVNPLSPEAGTRGKLKLKKPGRVVWLVPVPAESDLGHSHGLEGLADRDDVIVRRLTQVSPMVWSDLLRGAIDQGWAIRVTTPLRHGNHRPGLTRRITLAVFERPDRTRYEIVPLAEEDRQRLLAVFPGHDQAEDLPKPGELFRRAVEQGYEVTVRCDLRVIR
jgi:hypothetical protein